MLLLAVAVRLYHLDLPAMWWDEILVPMTASHPVGYILDFSRRCEMHPPLYHLFIKTVLAMGSSEVALRLPSAVAGVAGVWLLYRLARPLAGTGAALLAAALFVWQPAMVALSRQVRPYTLFLLAFLASLILSKRFLETGDRRGLLLLTLCNAALLFLHYVAVILVPFQVLAVAVFWLIRHGRGRLGWLAVYTGGTLAAFLAVSPFFFNLMARGKSNFTDLGGRADVLRHIGGILAGFLTPWESSILLGTICIVAALGGLILWRRDRFVCALLGAVVLGPLVVLVAARDSYVMYWHISFAAPILIFCLAVGLSRLLLRFAMPAAACIACLGAIWLVVARGQTLYANDPSAPLARNVARAVPDCTPPGALWSVPDMGLYNGTAWYLGQYRQTDPLRRQEYDASEVGRFYLVAAEPHFFEKYESEMGPVDTTGAPRLPGCRVVRGEIHPQGPFAVEDGKRLYTFTMEPERFYNQTDSLRDVTLTRGLVWQAVPTANDVPATFAYQFRNTSSAAGPVFVSARRVNQGRGGEVSLSVATDGGPKRLLVAEAGPVVGERLTARFVPETPFTVLTVTVGLRAGRETAAYPGGNLELAAVDAVTVCFAEPGLVFDLMQPATVSEDLRLSGIEGLERGEGHAWRWVMGPRAELSFPSKSAGQAVLRLRFSNPIPNQGVTVRVNGRNTANVANLPFARWMEDERTLEVPVALCIGENRIELLFVRHAQNVADPEATFSATDTRPLALALTGCALYEAGGLETAVAPASALGYDSGNTN